MVKIGYKVLLAADVWTYTPRGLTGFTGTQRSDLVGADESIYTRLDEKVSSRASATDYTSTRAAKLDYLRDSIPWTEKAIKPYPTDSMPVTVYSTTTAFAYGSWVEVIAAGAITSDFIIVGISHYQVAAAHNQIEIGKGSAGAEVAITKVADSTRTADGPVSHVIPIIPPLRVAANTRIAVRVTDNTTTAYAHYIYLLVIELPL